MWHCETCWYPESLPLPLPLVIDFTPLSLTIVFWVHLGERFRTQSAWEVHLCRSPCSYTGCPQSCTVNVLFDPQLNIWLIASLGKKTEETSRRQDKGWGLGMAQMRGGAGEKRRQGEKGVIKKKEKQWHVLLYFPINIFQSLHSLQNATEHSSSLSPLISPGITPFLVPAVHSSVSLWSHFSPTSNFSITSLPNHLYSFSPLSSYCLNTYLFVNKCLFLKKITNQEKLRRRPTDLTHKCVGQVLIISHAVDTLNIIPMCCSAAASFSPSCGVDL